MLSEKRKELLRKNKDKIAAYHTTPEKPVPIFSLARFYPDGTMCAGMAALTDEEQVIARENNDETIGKFAKDNDISDSDSIILSDLESLHDGVMCGHESFGDFENAVKEILEN